MPPARRHPYCIQLRSQATLMMKKRTKQHPVGSIGSLEPKQDHCVWSESDEEALIEFIITNKAKAGDGMNFNKMFWTTAATQLQKQQGQTQHGAPKTAEACQSKWVCIHKLYYVIDKIANASGISYSSNHGANIGPESETIWQDYIKNNPQAKGFKTKGWPHYEALQGIIPAQTSSWVGFHAGMDHTDNTLTPSTSTPGPPSASNVIMSALEERLEAVEFSRAGIPTNDDNDDLYMQSESRPSCPLLVPPGPAMPSIPPTPSIPPMPSIPATPVTPITPSFTIMRSPPASSTAASSTAVKRKADGDDSSCHESRPPLSSKGKGVSKSQHLTMPLAIEDLGGKVADSIANTMSVFQETVTNHFVEPVPLHKQMAVLQVQDEEELDAHEIVIMITHFQSDVSMANSYLNIKRDAVRKVWLAKYLKEYRNSKGKDMEA